METTKLSTKGQIVIPESLRRGFAEGTVFTISRKDDLLFLKKVEGLTAEEEKEMNELNEIWKDIDNGKCESYEVEDFFKKMKSW